MGAFAKVTIMDLRRFLCIIALVAPFAAHAQDEAPARTWSTFTSSDGSFSISMPATPAEQVTETPVEGATLTTTAYSLNLGAEGFYFVSYTDNPGLKKSDPDSAYDGIQSELEGAGTLLEQKPVTVDGFKGREIRLEMTAKQPGDVLTTARVLVAGDRLYQMLVSRQKATTSPEDQARFLDSFKILKKP